MVKKVKFKTSSKADDFDLDSFLKENDDFNSDFDLGGSEKSSNSSRFKSIQKGVREGLKSSLKSPSLYKNLVKSVMPSEYGDALDGVKGLRDTLKDIYSDSVRELKPGFQQIARQIDKMIPDEQKSLKNFTQRIKKLTGADLDSQSSMQSPEQLREQGIQDTLNSVLGLQAEQGARQRAADKAQYLIKEQADLKRFNVSTTLLSGIHTGISRLNAYNDRVNQAYQRKSLEIQLRSLFVQTDLLTTSKSTLLTIAQQNNELIRLSRLTEQEKILESKKFRKEKDGRFGSVLGGMLSKSGYLDSVKTRLKNAASSKVQSVKSAIEMGLMGLDQAGEVGSAMDGMDKVEMIASMITGQGLEYLSGKAASKFREKILPKGSRVDSKLGGILAAIRDPAYLAKTLSDSKYIKENDEDGLVKGSVKGFIRNLLGFLEPESIDKRLKKPGVSAKDLNDPSSFTNKTQLSITEIIPGYLARILREIQITRTNNPNIELTVYNPIKNRFMSQSRSSAATKSFVRKNLQNYGYGYSEDSALKEYIEGIKVSQETQNVLRKRLKDQAFNPKESMHAQSVLSDSFIEKQNADVQEELRKIQYKYNKDNFDSGRNLNKAHIAGDRLRSAVGFSDERSLIENLAKDPQLYEEMRRAGIVSGQMSNPEIDMEKYKEFATRQTSYSPQERIRFYKDHGYFDDAVKKGIIKIKDGKETIDRKLDEKFISGKIKLKATVTSDYYAKEGIAKQDGKSILEGIKKTRVAKWSYKDKDKYSSEKFVGPMAQDVKKNLGEEYAPNGKSLDLISLNGASMSAIGYLGKQVDQIKKQLKNRLSKKPFDLEYSKEAFNEYKNKNANTPKKSLLEQIADNTRMTYEVLLKKSSGFNLSMAGLNIESIEDLVKKEMSKYGFRRVVTFLKKASKAAEPIVKAGYSAVLNSAKYGWNKLKDFKDRATPAVKSGLNKLKNTALSVIDLASTSLKNTINPVVDVYNPNNLKKPLLEARNITEGLYINQDTGKPIYSLGDITGPIIDRRGNVLVSLKDLEDGLVDENGKPILNTTEKLKNIARNLIEKGRKAIFEKLPAGIKQAAQGMSVAAAFVKNAINKPRDIYVKGNMTTPVMYERDFYSERYFDLKTKKPIRTLSDIKGPVVDSAGNYVITTKDIEKGLVDINGKPILNLRQLLTGLALTGIGKLKDIASGAINKASDFLKNIKFPNINFGSIGFNGFTVYGKKTVDILEEIRDLLKQHFGVYTGENNFEQGELFPKEIQQEGLSISRSKSLINSGTISSIKSGFTKYKGKLSSIKNSGIVSKAGSLLKRIPGAGKIGSILGSAGTAVSSIFGSNKGASEENGKESPEQEMAQESADDRSTEQKENNSYSTLKNIKQKASNYYSNVRQSLLGKLQSGKDMTEVSAREKELAQQQKANESVKAQASLDPKYMNGTGMLGGILGKLKGFKKMLSSAFNFISDIPGVSKLTGLLKKIPGVGRVLGWGSKILGLGSAAEGVAAASGVAETAGAAGAAAVGGEAVAGAAAGGGLLASIGSAVATGATALGSTLLSAGAAIVSAPAMPFVLAGLAITGTLYAGYKYGKKRNANDLELFRMAQYGLTKDDKDLFPTLYNLEDYYSTITIAGDGGMPVLQKERIDFKKILDIFSIDPSNTLMVKSLSIYIAKRFNPIYFRTVASLWKIDAKYKISDIDKIDSAKMPEFIKDIQFSNGPYEEMVSPFLNLPKLKADTNVVKESYAKALSFVLNKKSGKDKCIAMRAFGFVSDVISGTWEMLKDGVKGAANKVWSGIKAVGAGIKNTAVGAVMGVVHGAEFAWSEAKSLGNEGLKLLAQCGIGSGPSTKTLPQTSKEKNNESVKAKTTLQKEVDKKIKEASTIEKTVGNPLLATAEAIATAPVALPAFLLKSLFNTVKKFNKNSSITPATQYRLTQYGLTPDQKEYNHYLLNLEAYYDSIVKKDVKGAPVLDKQSLDFKKIAEIFDISENDAPSIQQLTIYLYQRFNPVYMHSVAALWTVDSKLKIGDLDSLNPDQLKMYLDKARYDTGPYDIYVSPFKNLPRLTANSNWVKFEYDKALDYSKTKLATQANLNKGPSEPKSLKDKLISAFLQEKKALSKTVIPNIKSGFNELLGTIKEKAPNLYKFGQQSFDTVKSAFKTGYEKSRSIVDTGENYILKGIRAAKGVFEKVKKLYDIYGFGALSAFFESGGNPAIVSSGLGDNGGVSYGTFQLSSKTGGVQAFLNHYRDTPQVKKLLAAGPINSEQFKDTWKQLGNTDTAFAKMQADYNKIQYLDPVLQKLKNAGIDLSRRGPGVLSVLDATSDQYGAAGAAKVVEQSLKGEDLSKLTDADIISTIEDYKIKTVGSHFRSSSAAVQASVAKRFATEKDVALKLTNQNTTVAGTKKDIPAVASDKVVAPSQPKAVLTASTQNTTVGGTKKDIPAVASDKVVAPSQPKAVLTASNVAVAPTGADLKEKPYTASIQTPSTTPVSYTTSSVKPKVVSDQGQGFDMSALHTKMGDVSEILSQSLSVQQQMLVSLLQIAGNTGLLKTLSGQTAVKKENAPTLPPKPSINLARAI